MAETKLVVVYTHEGRGTTSCNVDVYTKKTWITRCRQYNQRRVDKKDRISLQKMESMWNNDAQLKDFFNTDYYELFGGSLNVTQDDQWLIIFDPDSTASQFQRRIDRVKKGVDLDTYVKLHYMEDHYEDAEDYPLTKDQWIIPSGPLDWTAETTYHCFKTEYCSSFWGWADGHDEDEPFLIDYTAGFRGFGLLRYNLDVLNLWS